MTVTDDLQEIEEKKVEELKAAVADVVEKHTALQAFCTKHTYVRYLRARSWSLPKATAMLKETLKWRLEVQPERLMWSDVEQGASSGKLYLLDHLDKQGRPVVVMVPRNENVHDPDLQIKYLIYILEKASLRAEEAGVGKMTWLLDFVGYTLKNAPPMQVSKATLNIVQNHYPERLGEAICYHAPRVFEVTWKAVRPFIDEVTRRKVTFVRRKRNGLARIASSFRVEGEEDVKETDEDRLALKFDLNLLDESLGGKAQCPFNIAKFSEVMMAEDMQRDANIAKLMI